MKHRIKKITKRIYAVCIEDKFDRAMTFCRAQEFYESPNPKFRNKPFSIWEYMKWYSLKNKTGFTYPIEWSGFNIPMERIKTCYFELKEKHGEKEITPYDLHMTQIMGKIETKVQKDGVCSGSVYIIGTDYLKGSTFNHELCHAFYSTDLEYKQCADSLNDELIKKAPLHFSKLKSNLLEMGYAQPLVKDETQAYIQFGHNEKEFCKGVPLEFLNEKRKTYIQSLYDKKIKNKLRD